MYLFYRGLWGPGTSVSLLPWFVGAWYECISFTMVCEGLVRVYHVYHGLWGLVRVYNFYHGLWGPGTSV